MYGRRPEKERGFRGATTRPSVRSAQEESGLGQDTTGEIVIEGEVERVTFESPASSFRVVKIAVDGRRERLALVGQFPPLSVGARVRARGKLVNDAKHGEQLQASSVTELGPNTLVGVERYLGSGLVKGIMAPTPSESWRRSVWRRCACSTRRPNGSPKWTDSERNGSSRSRKPGEISGRFAK